MRYCLLPEVLRFKEKKLQEGKASKFINSIVKVIFIFSMVINIALLGLVGKSSGEGE